MRSEFAGAGQSYGEWSRDYYVTYNSTCVIIQTEIHHEIYMLMHHWTISKHAMNVFKYSHMSNIKPVVDSLTCVNTILASVPLRGKFGITKSHSALAVCVLDVFNMQKFKGCVK